ncbi:MAG: response regulator transcription factor [Phycisphaerales bacterium]|nr:MAG: response regulator transcription factor [Phycisphaerales bacterium]
MRSRPQQHVFLVDDEPKILGAAREALEQAGLKVTCFRRGSDCLKQMAGQRCDLLVTDVRMPGVDGIELLAEARRIAPWLPVVVLTGYGDVEMAARAFKCGACDFIQKPFSRETLLSAVKNTLENIGPIDPVLGKSLSRMERRVLRLLLEGKSNKETAHLLKRCVRTVENHRLRIMRKFGVSNVFELFGNRADRRGLVEVSSGR